MDRLEELKRLEQIGEVVEWASQEIERLRRMYRELHDAVWFANWESWVDEDMSEESHRRTIKQIEQDRRDGHAFREKETDNA